MGKVKMLLRKNCNIIVNESEIDTSIFISKNVKNKRFINK